MKRFMLIFALLVPAAGLGQTVHPKFDSARDAFNYIQERGESVMVYSPGEANSSYLGLAHSRLGGYFGGGSFHSSDVFGAGYSSAPYPTLVVAVMELLKQKVWDSTDYFVEPSLKIASDPTVQGSANERGGIRFVSIGAGSGNASIPNRSPVIADFILTAFLAVAGEEVENGGFDGRVLGQAAQSASWRIGGVFRRNTARDVVQTVGGALSTVQIRGQSREVRAALLVAIADPKTGQIIWMNDGLGVGEVETEEFSARTVLGFEQIQTNYPNSYLLAVNTVEQAWE